MIRVEAALNLIEKQISDSFYEKDCIGIPDLFKGSVGSFEIAKSCRKSDSGGITRLSDYTFPHS